MPFSNYSLTKNGQLTIGQIRSPGYEAGASGWEVRKDGSAEFNDLTLRGQFLGTDYEVNAAGAFFYAGTPAAGNLLASITAAPGTDPYGNAYQAGVNVYGAGTSLTGIQDVAGQAILFLHPDASWAAGNAVSPNLFSSDSNAGAASEYMQLQVNSGAPSGQTGRRSRIVLYSGSPDGTTSVPHVSVFGGNSDFLLADIGPNGIVAGNPSNQLETWHSMTLQNGWAVGSGGIARYKLMPDNTVMIQLVNVTPGITTDGTIIWLFPGGYQPVTEQKLPLLAQFSTAPSYGSMPFLYTNTASGGALVVYNLRGTVSGIHASTFYTLD